MIPERSGLGARGAGGGPLPRPQPVGAVGLWRNEATKPREARHALAEAVARAAGVRPGDRVLELGCGRGESTVHYARRLRPGAVVAIDPDETNVRRGRAFVASMGLSDRVNFELGDATALGFPAGSFHRVLAIGSSLHFDTRYDFFREAERVLRPGGGLGLADLVLRKGSDREEFLQNVRLAVGSDGSLAVPENVYDGEVYAALLGKCGFGRIAVEDVTDRTLRPMIDHLERFPAGSGQRPGPGEVAAARAYREWIDYGLACVLVSARKVTR